MHPKQHLRKASIERAKAKADAGAAERPDRDSMRAAHNAPRCQHIRLNGQPCAAPALRGQDLRDDDGEAEKSAG